MCWGQPQKQIFHLRTMYLDLHVFMLFALFFYVSTPRYLCFRHRRRHTMPS
ncbi:unnamed protein product [Ceutorhynchus assimilis]|uniref:Uncharacterized protein n=1 Tax=Ceutorhynchus assimilis TaxID=467358 RepID=A0A9N9MI15_9CUCU|nr:unnamed protein product [Ceutorhynchus assimilis]